MARPKNSVPPKPVQEKKPEVRRFIQVGIHVLPEVAEALQRLADDRQTNVSQLGRQVLTEFVRKQSPPVA